MKKSNLPFIALTGASVVLISAIMADNITSTPRQPADHAITEKLRQEFDQRGLTLHEGKYWKKTYE